MPTRIKLFGDTQRADQYRFIAYRKVLADALMLRGFQNLSIYRHTARLPEGGMVEVICHHNFNEISIFMPPQPQPEEAREERIGGLLVFFVGNEQVGYHYMVLDATGENKVQDIQRADTLAEIEDAWPPAQQRDCYVLGPYAGHSSASASGDFSVCSSETDTPEDWGILYDDERWLPSLDDYEDRYSFSVLKDGLACFYNDPIEAVKDYIDNEFSFPIDAGGDLDAHTDHSAEAYQFYASQDPYGKDGGPIIDYPHSQELRIISPGLEGNYTALQCAVQTLYLFADLQYEGEIWSHHYRLPVAPDFPLLWGGTSSDTWPDQGWIKDKKLIIEDPSADPGSGGVDEREMHIALDPAELYDRQQVDNEWRFTQGPQYRMWMRQRYFAKGSTVSPYAHPNWYTSILFNRSFVSSFSRDIDWGFQVFSLQVPEFNGGLAFPEARPDTIMPREVDYTEIDGYLIVADPRCIDFDNDGLLDAPYKKWRLPIQNGTVYDESGNTLSMPWEILGWEENYNEVHGNPHSYRLEYGFPDYSDSAPYIVVREHDTNTGDVTGTRFAESLSPMYEEVRDRFWIMAGTGGADPRGHTRSYKFEDNLRDLLKAALQGQRDGGTARDYEPFWGEMHGYIVTTDLQRGERNRALRRLLTLINEERKAQGVDPYIMNWDLSKAATRHAADSAQNGIQGHQGSDGTYITERAMDAGFHFGGCLANIEDSNLDYCTEYFNSDDPDFGENTGQTSELDPDYVFELWKNSSDHYPNMIDSHFEETGMDVFPGQDGLYYWVNTFGYNPSHFSRL